MPISEIEIGDAVIAYDEDTGKTGEYAVTDTISHEDEQIAYVTIAGEEIETTPWHLFYTSEGWVEAEDLQKGDSIVSLGGVYGTVDSVIVVDATQIMYDLTVEEVHTFAVGDGNWVVHNVQCTRLSQDEIDEFRSIYGIPTGELDGQFEHSFDRHAHEWFGTNPMSNTEDNMAEWLELISRATQSNNAFRWDFQHGETIAHLARLDGKWFVVHWSPFGEFITAYPPKGNILTRMLEAAGIN